MRAVRISEDFVPVSEFKAQAAEWLRRIGETGAPLVVTQNGKPAGVLLSPRAFDELTERSRFAADAEAGRVQTHASVKRRMRSRYGGKAK